MTLTLALILLAAAGGKEYPDGHGGTVKFPLGDVSFADEVVSTDPGKPACTKANANDPSKTVFIPDYVKKTDTGTYTLGCGGTLVVRFTDNALVDVEGPDLYVFEVGPQIEATTLAISDDGTTWVEVGKIEGGRAEVDISAHAKPGDVFHLVKLTDLKKGCGGGFPGADIDAVGAIGSGLQISLKSEVLFETGKSALKPEALAELDAAAAKIKEYPGSTVIVSGHTDSVGTPSSNKTLSEARAAAVRDRLKGSAGLESLSFKTSGHGAACPVATNDTPEGREKNRRVEIVVLPAK